MPDFFQNFIDNSCQNKNKEKEDEVIEAKNFSIEKKKSHISKKIKYPEIISPFTKGEIVRIKNDKELKGTLVTIHSIHEDYVRVYSNANYMSEKLFKVSFSNVVKVKRDYTEN